MPSIAGMFPNLAKVVRESLLFIDLQAEIGRLMVESKNIIGVAASEMRDLTDEDMARIQEIKNRLREIVTSIPA